MKDDALWKRLQAGERAAFEQWLDRDGALVRALCGRMGASATEADDLTQEIWIAAFQNLGSFRGDALLSTWIYRLAINHCLKWREKAGRAIPLSGEDAEALDLPSLDQNGLPPRQLERRELGDEVRRAIETLPDHHRTVVVLHEFHGLSYAQCAQALDIPVGTVKSRLSNAFGKLRALLGPYVLSSTELNPTPPQTRVLAPQGESS